jgi:hypothetical protein
MGDGSKNKPLRVSDLCDSVQSPFFGPRRPGVVAQQAISGMAAGRVGGDVDTRFVARVAWRRKSQEPDNNEQSKAI